MFTGIIEDIGIVRTRVAGNMTIGANCALQGMRTGDSIAVDGVCLTVVNFTDKDFSVRISEESFARTTLDDTGAGSHVNLERAMMLGDRLGGHVVQGHVDGVGYVSQIRQQGDFSIWSFNAPSDVSRYLVPRGSISIDGISLTVINLNIDTFDVAVIPATLDATTLRTKKPGDRVNMEADIFGKHVFHYLQQVRTPNTSTELPDMSTFTDGK